MKQLLQTLFFFLLVTQICFAQLYQTNGRNIKDTDQADVSAVCAGENNLGTRNVNKSEHHPKQTERNKLPKSTEASLTNIDSLIQAFMNTNHVPGLAACIVKNDRIEWEGYYGFANIATQDSVKPSTIFMLASISKTVTASALMQLYEQGRFQLDDSINAYLPFAVRNPNFPTTAITFRHLLTHSSSIRDGYYPYYWGTDPQIDLETYLRGNLTPEGAHYSPSNYSTLSPGVLVSYCNIGLTLCGYLVQVISGVPFDVYCRDSIFVPLEMSNTAWFLKDLDVSLIAHPYIWNGGSSYSDYGHYGYASYPDGELRTTVRSLAKWLIANINFGKFNGVRVLDSTTAKMMRTVKYWPQNWGGVGLGLVWMTWTFPDGRQVWYHDGRDKGVSTSMNLDEVQKTGVIILTNVNPINEDAFTALQNTLFNIADTLVVSVLPEESVNDLPTMFSLSQNYPNPFNPSTKISWQLPVGSNVILKVYDILGRQVATLVDEYRNAGNYETEFDVASLPSGVYFYQLKAGLFIEMKKMILLR